MILLLAILGLLTFYLFKFYSHVRKLPPGPFPLPFIGNFHQMTQGVQRHKGIIPFLNELKKKYGDVVTFFMGPFEVVHIFDYNLAVQAMVTNGTNFIDRNIIEYSEAVRHGRGVTFSNGQHWHEQRKFGLSTLKRFGMGRNIKQDKIMEEFNFRSSKLKKEIEACGGSKTIDPGHLVERTVGNIINRIILSDGFTEKEERLFVLKQKIPYGPQMLSGGSLVSTVEVVIIGADEETLAVTIADLWIGGQHTTAGTLCWALTYILLHPEEVLRLSAIVPMNIFRVAKEDTKIGEHFVPKGTAVSAQLPVIMSDPKVFPDANEFKPERFLGKDLEQYVVPFGLGKRACLGEAAARTEIYLILGNLFLSYDLQVNEDNLPQMGAINESGDIRLPHSFTVTVSIRT